RAADPAAGDALQQPLAPGDHAPPSHPAPGVCCLSQSPRRLHLARFSASRRVLFLVRSGHALREIQPGAGPTMNANHGRHLAVDAHTHIFCWGENPVEGFLSQRTRTAWRSRLLLALTGVRHEPGATLSAKMRSLLLRHLRTSQLDYIVVLAQDAVYRADGT